MNVTSVLAKDYEKTGLSDKGKTNPIQTQYKPNSNPICRKAKMNVTSILTKDYENKPPSNSTKTNPKQTQSNPIFKNSAPFLTGVDKLCQIMDNEIKVVHNPEAGREIDAFACKTK